MNREAFEKWWCDEYGYVPPWRNGNYLQPLANENLVSFCGGYQAATEHAQPKWIPYKDGDVIEDGWYLVTIFYAIPDSAVVVVDRRWKGCWDIETYDYTVTAYRRLPTPFVPEVSDD